MVSFQNLKVRIEMLSVEIVRMVEDYEGFANDDYHLTERMRNHFYSEIWGGWELYNLYSEEYFPRLNQKELELLKNILIYDFDEEKRDQNFRAIANFICWFIEESDWICDLKDDYYYERAEDYYMRGVCPYAGFKPEDFSDDRLPMGKISFFKEYFKKEMFKNMGPVWFECFRLMIEEGSERISSKLIKSGDPSAHL